MKAETEIAKTSRPLAAYIRVSPAPSLRLPVTAANRDLLRQLRREEAAAWEAGHLWERETFRENSTSAHELL